jgi:hypothetical protein
MRCLRVLDIGTHASPVSRCRSLTSRAIASDVRTPQPSRTASARRTYSITANGEIAGWLLSSEIDLDDPAQVFSEFDFIADVFRISGPSGGVAPFEVITETSEIDGVSVEPGVYIKQASIREGIIGSAQIANVIQSSNFRQGVEGWRLQKDGSGEFNGIVLSRDLVVEEVSHALPVLTIPNHSTLTPTYSFWVETSVSTDFFNGNNASYVASVNHQFKPLGLNPEVLETDHPTEAEWAFSAEIASAWTFNPSGPEIGTSGTLRVLVTLSTRRIKRIENWAVNIKIKRVT